MRYQWRLVPFVTAALLVAAYGLAACLLWANQRTYIFFPIREVNRTPADVGLNFEEVRFNAGTSPDVSKLHGWWVPSLVNDAPALLYLHGNDGNIGSNLDHVAALYRIGFSVLVFDYRGYGKSEGAFPSELQLYDDAVAAWDYLLNQRRVEPSSAFIFGHSLGGAVAIELALRRPAAAGVIVESSFTSLAEMAKIRYWMFPVDWIVNQRFDSLTKVPMLQVPVLFIHGTGDKEVPFEMSERLFAATRGAKSLTLIRGGGHEDNAEVDEPTYTRAIVEFARAHKERL